MRGQKEPEPAGWMITCETAERGPGDPQSLQPAASWLAQSQASCVWLSFKADAAALFPGVRPR